MTLMKIQRKKEKQKLFIKNFREDTFVKLQDETVLALGTARTFYGLTDQFPLDTLFTRSSQADKIRKIYYTNLSLTNLLFEPSLNLRIINCGVRIFNYEKKKE